MRLSNRQIEILRKAMLVEAIPDEQDLFIAQCERMDLDPFSRQIYAVFRWNKDKGRKVMSVQVSIDGLRLVAERTGKYQGQLGPFWCGEDGEWRDVWLPTGPPAAAKTGVLKEGFREPLWAVARYASYCQRNQEGKPLQFWSQMPDIMLAKASEALALRRAFPQEMSGAYLAEEVEWEERIDSLTGEILLPPPPPPPPQQQTKAAPPDPKPANGSSKKPPSREALASQLQSHLQAEGIPANEWAGWLICEGKLEAHPEGDHFANLRPSQLQGLISRWGDALAAYQAWRQDHLAETPPQESSHEDDDQPEESSAKVARAQELATRVELREGYAVVPSTSRPGVTYQVAIDEGGVACECQGYCYRVQANPDYQCVHVMATKIALVMAARAAIEA